MNHKFGFVVVTLALMTAIGPSATAESGEAENGRGYFAGAGMAGVYEPDHGWIYLLAFAGPVIRDPAQPYVPPAAVAVMCDSVCVITHPEVQHLSFAPGGEASLIAQTASGELRLTWEPTGTPTHAGARTYIGPGSMSPDGEVTSYVTLQVGYEIAPPLEPAGAFDAIVEGSWGGAPIRSPGGTTFVSAAADYQAAWVPL